MPRDPYTPWRLWALTALALILIPVACQPVKAQTPTDTVFNCRALAEAIAPFADFRDAGADLPMVIAMLRERTQGINPARRAVVEREIRRLWLEGLPRLESAFQLYERCERQLGQMGQSEL